MRVVWLRFNRKEKFVMLAIAAAIVVGGGAAGAFILGGAGTQSASGDINLDKGLVDWWKLDGNGKDSTPYANDATLVSSPTATTDREGRANSAYSFNGTSQYLATSNSISMNSGSFSVSAWFKTSSANDQKIVSNNVGFHELQTITSKLRICINTCTAGSTTVADGNWHFAVVVGDATSIRVYLDGNTTPEITQGALASAMTGTLAIGNVGNGSSPNYFFTGSIDDVRVYNRALNVAETKALFKEYRPGLAAASGENSLVGWWRMDGNAKDSTPNADNGGVSGATLTTDREGRANSAYSFNGTNSTIGITNTSVLQNAPTNQWSMSAWVNPTATSGAREIIRKDAAGLGYFIRINTGTFESLYAHGGTFTQESSGTVVTGQWQLLTSTYDGTTIRHYINGSLVNSWVVNITLSFSASNVYIGSDNNSNEWFSGSIDDARIYNRALSAAEIATMYKEYDSQLSVSSLQSGKVGDWPFNGNAKDSTPNSDNGTITAATLTTDREGRANSAYSFNGTSATINVGNVTPLQFERTNAFSVGAWIKTSSAATGQTIVSKMADSAPFTGYEFGLLAGVLNVYLINTWSTNVIQVKTTGTVNDNAWHYVVATYNGSSAASGVQIYVDGSPASTTTVFNTLSATLLNSISVQIGSRNNTNYYFNGSLDDVRIWNRALSSAEVTALYKEYR